MLMSNFRINVSQAKDCWFSIFCDSCQPVPSIIHPAYAISFCSFPDSVSSYDTLNLMNVANSRGVSVMHLKILFPLFLGV